MRIVSALLVVMAGSADLLTAQQVPVAPTPAPPGAMVEADLLVSPAWLAERLGDPRIVVLHVGRDDASYRAGHIPGARFLPIEAIVTERDGLPTELPSVESLISAFEALGVGDRSRVVLYDDQDGLLAARAFFTLEFLGHGSVALLDGGLAHWRSTRRQLSTDAPAPERARLTPRPRPDLLVSANWIRDRLHDPTIALVDARPNAQFSGEQPGDGIERPGRIPGAQNLFWRTTLRGEHDPRLRDPRALRASFGDAGALPGRTVVAYCRTGLQASHTYFVARYLGHDVKLYDGSFMEWSRTPGLPVAR